MGNSSLFFQGLETETKRGKDLCGERNGTDGRSSFWVLLTLTAAEGLGFSIVRRGDFNLSCFAFSLVGLFCVEVAFFAGPSPFYFLRSFCFLFFCCVGFFPFPGVDFKRLQMVGFFIVQVWFVINSCRFGPSFFIQKSVEFASMILSHSFANQITDFYTAKLDKQLWPTFFNFSNW